MTNLAVVFLTGLTTGGLSCLAVQGGLLASSVANQAQDDFAASATGSKRSDPAASKHVALPIALFLGSKLFAYTILGLLLGWIGSALALTPQLRALVQIAIGIFMLGTALRILNVHPIFRYFNIEPPKKITRYIRRKSKNSDGQFVTPIFLGALTVLIPCGITTAMMALAIGSGSLIAGALIMAAFVLGTSPVFFGLAYFATKLGEKMHEKFLKVAGAVILVLGLFAIEGGLNLAGSPVSFSAFVQNLASQRVASQAAANQAYAPVTGEAASPSPSPAPGAAAGTAEQSASSGTLNMIATSQAYSPQVMQAKAGQAYKLVIDSQNNRGCGRSLVIPALNLQTTLSENGQSAIDLPPQKAGTMRITCIMGMYNSRIQFN